jgi:hypothetical protein
MNDWKATPVRGGTRKRSVPQTISGIDYVGQTTIARHFGVGQSAVSNWLARPVGAPMPDATVEGVPLWRRDRLAEWERWFATLTDWSPRKPR